MPTDMRKTPAYLKGLAETRARAAGEVRRHARQKTAIESQMHELETELAGYQQMYVQVCQTFEDAKSDLESCDRLIRKFDGRLDPEQIEPIAARKGKYGGHGRLREAISELLKDCHPEALSTGQVALMVAFELDLEFTMPQERKGWTHNSVGRALNVMVDAGLVERMHDPAIRGQQEFGRWRWAPDANTGLGALAESAAQAGIGVSQAKRRGRPSTKLKPKG